MLALDLTALCLVLLVWGVLGRRVWAWWGSLGLLGFLLVSSVATFATATLPEALAPVHFAQLEWAIVTKVPLGGYALALLTGVPLLATWLLLLVSRDALTDLPAPIE